MSRCADIKIAPTSLEIGRERRVKAIVTATNAAGRSFMAGVVVKAEGETLADWIKVDVARFAFPIDKTQSIEVSFEAPPDARPGKYGFQIQIVDVGNPDEFYDNSETVVVAVPEPIDETSWWSRNWRVVLAIAGGVVVIGGGVAAFRMWWPSSPPPPPPPPPVADASTPPPPPPPTSVSFRRTLTAWDQPEKGWTGYSLNVADVSGDGKADLVWNQRAAGNRTYVALSNGDGTFRRALAAWDQPEQGWTGYSLNVVDVSGDGKADLVWNERAAGNRTYVALSNGDGTFRQALTGWDQPEQGWTGYSLNVVDVSGDGKADLVWNGGGATNRTYVALSNGDGTFRRALTAWDQPEPGWTGYSLSVADVSGDGKADLLWNQRAAGNRTYVALSNGDGTFRRALTAWDQPEPGWTGYSLNVVDVSGDGKADLVWNQRAAGNRTYVALSNGDGTFRRALTAWDQPEPGWTGYSLNVVDVSGDGKADLVWNGGGATNRTYVSLSNGDGTFRRVLTAWDQPEPGWTGYSLDVADVNGDKKADLIWSSRTDVNRTYGAVAE